MAKTALPRDEFPVQSITEPVRRWDFSVRRHYGVFLLGVVLPWRRFDPCERRYEYSAGFGYWMFVLRHNVIGWRVTMAGSSGR